MPAFPASDVLGAVFAPASLAVDRVFVQLVAIVAVAFLRAVAVFVQPAVGGVDPFPAVDRLAVAEVDRPEAVFAHWRFVPASVAVALVVVRFSVVPDLASGAILEVAAAASARVAG